MYFVMVKPTIHTRVLSYVIVKISTANFLPILFTRHTTMLPEISIHNNNSTYAMQPREKDFLFFGLPHPHSTHTQDNTWLFAQKQVLLFYLLTQHYQLCMYVLVMIIYITFSIFIQTTLILLRETVKRHHRAAVTSFLSLCVFTTFINNLKE